MEHQVLVFLQYLGNSGSGGSNPYVRNIFGIGHGTADKFKYHCINAIHSLQDYLIFWPNQTEWKDIASCMFVKYDWVNCIGIANGTLFPLTYEPQSEDAPDYHGCKFAYLMITMIVNDDNKRI